LAPPLLVLFLQSLELLLELVQLLGLGLLLPLELLLAPLLELVQLLIFLVLSF
jgi:hypothetical protein